MAARQVPALFAAAGAAQAALEVLDTQLLVFIVVELLFAVRITIAKRELIAEPFLLVGIIASIKEIVVLSVKAADQVGTGGPFSDSMWEVGALGVLVLLLGITAYLLRLKEREPGRATRAGRTRPPRVAGTERSVPAVRRSDRMGQDHGTAGRPMKRPLPSGPSAAEVTNPH